MFGTIMNDEEKKEGLEIIEEDAFELEISDEELEQFYEDNKDAIDLIGGLDMFESLMGLDDESFEQLKPQVLQLFAETLHEPESIAEFRTLAIAQGYTAETMQAQSAPTMSYAPLPHIQAPAQNYAQGQPSPYQQQAYYQQVCHDNRQSA